MAPKKKQEKMSIGAFLQDESLGSWADEMEDMPLPSTGSRTTYGSERRNFSSQGGAGGDYQDRRDGYPPREQLPLPTQPPYTAHLGNMSFDTTQTAISDFFKDCEVTNVRIVEDKMDRRPKGFGYVEFGSLEGLKKALSYNGSQLDGRAIRVSVADPPKDRQDGRDFSDWSRKGPLPELPGSTQRRVSERPAFSGRSFDNVSDAGSDRGGRRPFEQGDGKVRDFSNWERRGPLSPAASAAPSLQEGGRQASRDGPGFRKSSPAWGEGKSQEGSRPPRREFQEKPAVERAPTAPELDNQWRTKMRPDAPAHSPTPSGETSNPPSPAPVAAPTARPKLNLQKRTVSEAEPGISPAPAAAESKASPFGAARPVDTLARDKEIEEKRQLAIRQKKEADEKARAEKAEEKRLTRDVREPKEKSASESDGKESVDIETKEDSTETKTTPAGQSFEILRRTSEAANNMVAEEDFEGEDEGENGAIVEDKAVKPKEVVRDAPAKTNGAWRNKETKKQPPAEEETATNLEEEGWSTVSKNAKPRNNRRGNQAPARAIAS